MAMFQYQSMNHTSSCSISHVYHNYLRKLETHVIFFCKSSRCFSFNFAFKNSRQADIAIVVVGATSGESVDRPNLTLENAGNELIEAVAAVNGGSTIVLMQICGAVLMPWKHQVGSILSMFLGGEATGSAWAQVLFGDVSPSGRLPIMMPETESDSIAPSDEESGGEFGKDSAQPSILSSICACFSHSDTKTWNELVSYK